MSFKEMNVSKIDMNSSTNGNVFDMIGKTWMLVTAARSNPGSDQEIDVNAMTASWGGLGIMWGKPVAFIFIRPQRYTKEFIDISDDITLSFYDETHRKMLSYMGSVSGRNEDKIKHEGLRLNFEEGAPYFEEAWLVLKVKKLYAQEMSSDYLKDSSIAERWYPDKDWHTMYICEIEKVLVRE